MGKNKRSRVDQGSGNVFADLDLPHAEQELLKARLTLQIYRIIKDRGLTQARAGAILGIKQPHVSALMRNRAEMFSIERLMEFLTHLGQDVDRAPDAQGAWKSFRCRGGLRRNRSRIAALAGLE